MVRPSSRLLVQSESSAHSMRSTMQRLRSWIWAATLTLGCSGGTTGPRPAPEPLRVAAASDLQTVVPEIPCRVTKATGIEVVVILGSSGQLAQQIRQGAPFDVFLAANRKFVDDLATEGAIRPGSVRPYARGSLVLAVSRHSGVSIESLT